MANTFTDLVSDIYVAADIVARELVGFIPAVTINRGSEVAAFGDTVRAAYTRQPTLNTAYNPSMTIPEGDDQVVDNKTMTISQVANVKMHYNGEEVRSLDNGVGFQSIYGDQITQAMRTVTNAIEAHVATVVYQGASRATGAAGTTPFGSNFDTVAEARQILVDNGTPTDGQISMVMNTLASTKLRNLAQLQKANEAGGDSLLRQGVLLDLQGVAMRESAEVQSHVKGTAVSSLVNGALAVGATAIVFDTATAGATGFKAGDVITFAADTVNKYVVETGLVGTSGTITIAGPGLRVAIPDNNAITVGATYTGNSVFHRQAVELVSRAPQEPPFGDAATFTQVIQDPLSGLSYRVSVYQGYGKNMIDVSTYYQAKVWKPDFVATLLG
jgi:hypothetical protein|tara:strand:+ start:243 stop:1400 length:1158 start_codon:yes stop_codon:yes gene_type:complete